MGGPEAEIRFEHCFVDGNARVRVTVTAGEQVFVDEFKITSDQSRTRFAAKVAERFGALDEEAVHEQLNRIVRDFATRPDPSAGDAAGTSSRAGTSTEIDDGESASKVLVSITRRPEVELFHGPGGEEAEAYVTISNDKSRKTFPVRSIACRGWLTHAYLKLTGNGPGAQALTDALNTVCAIALHEGPERAVGLRIAECEGATWIDLGDETGRAVRIDAAGWRVVAGADVPVRFIRRRGMLPLPEPVRGGSLESLRTLLNLASDDAWHLFLVCLVAFAWPRGPFPVLALNGEQGSGKSALCRMLRALIDPNKAPLRRLPRDERDLLIAASNSRLLCFDNVSTIPPWLSDAMCALATGAGFGTRQLYSDDEERLFECERPILLNGIEEFIVRPDLLDRAVVLTLPTIAKDKRRRQRTIEIQFGEQRACLLGALFDVLSRATRVLPTVELANMPRMADFATLGVAVERALGWPDGSFLRAYGGNQEDAQAAAIEASPVGIAVLAFMHERAKWVGSAGDLLVALETHRPQKSDRGLDSWPGKPGQLWGALRRIQPILRTHGLEIRRLTRTPGGNRQRRFQIAWDPTRGASAHEGAQAAVHEVRVDGCTADVHTTLVAPEARESDVPGSGDHGPTDSNAKAEGQPDRAGLFGSEPEWDH